MQGFQPSAHHRPSSLFSDMLHSIRSNFTPRRVAFTAAASLIVLVAILIATTGVASRGNDESHLDSRQVFKSNAAAASVPEEDASDTSTHATSSSTHTTFSSQTTNGTTQTSLNVNGQDIAVPSNGSDHHTVTNRDGSQTTVDVSGNTSSQDSSSSSSVNVNVQSSSNSSSGGS
jgi:hypothetical protein